ncbi:MAG: T9SS type A sorting domain-containing protein [Candidatus Stygibacter australis]|nr:T9SS type A sorting domain-containing protein [Candidatus Stygibacter australis]
MKRAMMLLLLLWTIGLWSFICWDAGDRDDYDGLNITKINVYFQNANCTITAKAWTGVNADTEILRQTLTAPVADAGIDQVVRDGETITLDGSGSYDPDDDVITYIWTAPAGITLNNAAAEMPTFIAPEVNNDIDYTFTLVVSDGEQTDSDQVVVTVQQDEPRNVDAVHLTNPAFIMLTWEAPGIGGETGEWIHYDDGMNDDGIGITNGGSFRVAARWDAGDLDDYDGLQITKMNFVPREAGSTYTLKVWTGVNASNEVLSQPVTDLVMEAWNEVYYTSPITIDSADELWIGYAIDNQPAGSYPAGCDAGPAIAGYGDMISMSGGAWQALSALELDYNWNIQAWVTGAIRPLPKAAVSEAPEVIGFLTLESNEFARGNLRPASSDTRDERSFLLGFYVFLDDVQYDEDLLDIDETSYIFLNMIGNHSYGVAAVYNDGMSDIESIGTDTDGNNVLPVVTALTSVYPNPFNPETNISFELAGDGFVLIEVYNIKGQKIATVLKQEMAVGAHTVIWNAEGQNSGIYFLRFEADGKCDLKKVILLK